MTKICDKLLISVLSFVACVHIAECNPASFITKCKQSDSKCIKQSTQEAIPIFVKGIPEIGMDAIEPLYYDHLDASSKDLKLILSKITVTGMKDIIVKKIERDAAKNKLTAKAFCTFKMDGQYEMDGRLLILPIQGKGDIHAMLRKVQVDIDADVFEKVGKDGKKHWDLKGWKHTFQLMDKAELDLQNLFNGNEVLGSAVRDLLKTSANDVIDEVGPPIIKALMVKIAKTVNVFFNKVPLDDLVLE